MLESEEQLSKQKIEDFRKLLIELHRTNSLFISRVPKQTKEAFIKLAHDEFEGDYGFTLKSLFDLYAGLLPPKDAQLNGLLKDLNKRIYALESKKEEPVGKEIRLADGTMIKKLRGE